MVGEERVQLRDHAPQSLILGAGRRRGESLVALVTDLHGDPRVGHEIAVPVGILWRTGIRRDDEQRVTLLVEHHRCGVPISAPRANGGEQHQPLTVHPGDLIAGPELLDDLAVLRTHVHSDHCAPNRGRVPGMAVPGTKIQGNPPADVAGTELFAIDAYRRSFDSTVLEVDREQGRIALARTAFYPGGGGQPHDLGQLTWSGTSAPVTKVRRESGHIWHWLDTPELPSSGVEVLGELDWDRRHLLMRTHTALHILCGVIWSEFQIPVTGGNMDPGKGRLDFPFDAMSVELGQHVERRINEEIQKAREIVVQFLGRTEADLDESLIRTAANLIPREIDPLRVIDIVGLDRQADGGTHLTNTADVGTVAVTGTESKGKGNKRIRIEVRDPQPENKS